jgi:hypothetical protein
LPRPTAPGWRAGLLDRPGREGPSRATFDEPR